MASDDSEFAFENINSGIWEFLSNFVKNLENDSHKNAICSPFSVYNVLAMLSLGAKGKTLEQLQSGLELPADKSSLKSFYKQLQTYLKNSKEVDVQLANKIFSSKNFELLPAFDSDMKAIFESDVQKLDYSDPVKSVKAINDWAAEKTNNKIRDLLSPDAITAESALVLVNAIHFKGPWEYQFDPENTGEKDFSLLDSTKIKVPTMFINEDFNCGTGEDFKFKWVELPFKNNEFSMIISVLGNDEALLHVQKNIYKVNFTDLLKSGSRKNLNLYLPKFKIESKWNLENTLRGMGIGDIFDRNADFSGMSKVPVRVSDVIQKAFINVDESGCEAAAATACRMLLMCMKYPEDFHVDSLFIYTIVHKKGGPKLDDLETVTPLFVGTVTNPIQS